MTLVTCGNCGQRVAVTALAEHADECRRIAVAKTLKGAAQPAPQSPPQGGSN